MDLLEQQPNRYMRWPRLVADGEGARLHVLAWEPGAGERTLELAVRPDGTLDRATEVQSPLSSSIVGWQPDDPPTPAHHGALFRDRATSAGWSVRIDRHGYRSEVRCRLPSGAEHLVWSAEATAAAPAIARAANGVWIAFHHNLREDNARPDLAKWIALRFVDDDGRVFAPAAPMPDLDRDAAGEEQSFEFPALVVGSEGAVAVFGRGSHRYWRQDLGLRGFAPRVGLDDGTWGCRGMHIAALGLPSGKVLTAWREKRGIVVGLHDPPRGGRPRCVVAETLVLAGPARYEGGTRIGRPDPARRDARITLFGDIQQHSAHSDGIGSADEPYLRARHVYGDDFAALTDHESFLGKRTSPGEWDYLQEVAERWDDPGAFATIVAYEWTGRMFPGPGHKCVYLPGVGYPIVSRDDVPEGRVLVQRVGAHGALTGPHHIGWTGADIPGHDPTVQTVWEICSCHGCYEHPDHPLGQRGELRDQMVDAALARGLRFGFIANSDSHGLLWHHGESRKRDPFRTGLTAVQARQRTRDAILGAIRERRCYATSGAHILLDVRAGDAPMGSEVEEAGPHEVEVVAHGTTRLRRVELVTSDGVIASDTATEERSELRAWVRDARYVYARVTQEDGEMAWSSPIFFGPRA